MLDKFLEVVLDVKGNIASRRFTKKFFESNGKAELWDWFEVKSELLSSYDNRSILFLLRSGIYVPPCCTVCGQPVKVQFYSGGGHVSDYCSLACSNQAPDRAKKISETKLSWSEDKKAEVKEKLESTLLERHGRKTISYKGKPTHNRKELPVEDITHSYSVLKKSLVELGGEHSCDYDTIRTRLVENDIPIRRTSRYSREEVQIKDYIESLGVEVVHGDWSVLESHEVDLLIPNFDFAIEMDGLLWHSYDSKCSVSQKQKHLQKTLGCAQKGIELWHITDEQWNKKKPIVSSMIAHRLNKAEHKVYARKCSIKAVSTKEAREFFDSNHIQGFAPAFLYLGLYHNDQLVFSMSFGKARYNQNYDYELIRSAAKLNTSIVGGFSRLLKHFKSIHTGSLISYADRRYSKGLVYLKNGFEFIGETKVGYAYTDSRTTYSRVKFQKHKLKELLENFDPELTEEENMFSNGYRQIWDCGQLVFVMKC